MDFEYICMYVCVCVFILHLGLSSIPIHFFFIYKGIQARPLKSGSVKLA